MQRHRLGRIINFVTFAIPFTLEGEAVHAASKAAVVSLTEVMARELAEFGITVNAIAVNDGEAPQARHAGSDRDGHVTGRQHVGENLATAAREGLSGGWRCGGALLPRRLRVRAQSCHSGRSG